MQDATKNLCEVVISGLQTAGVAIGALWAYFRFWREGIHRPRLEFDIQCQFLGVQAGTRVVSFVIVANNKGNIEHKFSRVSLRVRGITRSQNLSRRKDERLNFPESLFKAELIPEEFIYYFVRPGIAQPFTFTTTVPEDIRFILARAAFKYENSNDLHTSERVFEVPQATFTESGIQPPANEALQATHPRP